jgi:inhibitor of cysteine peptidase
MADGGAPTRIGPDRSGGVIAVQPGDLVEVALPQNAGTGYRWQLDPLPPGLVLIADATEPPSEATPGATGVRVFTLRADRSGSLVARLRREWEPAGEAAGTFAVRVATS